MSMISGPVCGVIVLFDPMLKLQCLLIRNTVIRVPSIMTRVSCVPVYNYCAAQISFVFAFC